MASILSGIAGMLRAVKKQLDNRENSKFDKGLQSFATSKYSKHFVSVFIKC